MRENGRDGYIGVDAKFQYLDVVGFGVVLLVGVQYEGRVLIFFFFCLLFLFGCCYGVRDELKGGSVLFCIACE